MANTLVKQDPCQITSVNTLADRLKFARERFDPPMSQSDLAKRAKVSQGTIGNLEAGTRKSPRSLLSIARALGVSPHWLETGVGPMLEGGHLSGNVTGDSGTWSGGFASVSLDQALTVVLEAIARAPDKARLRTALMALLDDDAPAYRQRVAELLNPPLAEPGKRQA